MHIAKLFSHRTTYLQFYFVFPEILVEKNNLTKLEKRLKSITNTTDCVAFKNDVRKRQLKPLINNVVAFLKWLL